MTPLSSFLPAPPMLVALALAAWLSLAGASPGAHGPNGEHLDGPPSAVAPGSAQPRFEAHSELFEIVGRLDASALQLYINRYESNEAVLRAKVEVELGGAKAGASFNAEAGSYVVNDKSLLAALAQPGRHALVFTISAGSDTDLLDATLAVAAHGDDAAHGSSTGPRYAAFALLGGGALVIAALALLRRGRRPPTGFGAAP
jgi:hypothetical protein